MKTIMQLVANAYPLRYSIKKRQKLDKDSELLCDRIRAVDVDRLLPEKLAGFTLSTPACHPERDSGSMAE